MKNIIVDETTKRELVRAAKEAAGNAYAPYSGYKVGAALLCDDGSRYTGCNVENAAYPCGICAERTAAAKAVSEGNRDFRMIAVVGSSAEKCTPCGMCRQVLYEFAPDMTVLCADNSGEYDEVKLSDLLIRGFGASSLK
ncbi:MAG: cytidine deaminase [Ruminiclostridium sp.]|nr:cytidine deaminase [Ruminiclostridium sp.]